MNQLPADILKNIFSYLEVKTVLNFRRVCKQWRQIINGSCFGSQLAVQHWKNGVEDPILLLQRIKPPSQSRNYDNNPSPNPNPNPNKNNPYPYLKCGKTNYQQRIMEINLKLFPWPSSSSSTGNRERFFCESSAHGILCITRSTLEDKCQPYLVNPMRQEVLELPPLNLEPLNTSQNRYRYCSFGLGFDESLRNCKVVCVVADLDADADADVFDSIVYYTLNQQKESPSSSSKWSQVITKSQPQCVPLRRPRCIGGVVYWVSYNPNYDHDYYVIMAFHLEKEELRLVSLPVKVEDHSHPRDSFELIDDVNKGHLIFVDLSSTTQIALWNLNEEENKWVEMYRFKMSAPQGWPHAFHPYRVLGPWGNGEILLCFRECYMAYNPNTDTFKHFSVPPLEEEDEYTQYHSYSPSLLSLSWFQ